MEAATGMGVATIGPLTVTTVASAAAQHGGYIAVTSEHRHAFELTVVTNASSREAGEHAIALTGHSIRDAFRSLRRGLRRELLGIHTYTATLCLAVFTTAGKVINLRFVVHPNDSTADAAPLCF